MQLVSFFVPFIVAVLSAPYIIKMLKRLQFGQIISEDAPESHQIKAGTPTMGGLIILIGLIVGWGSLYVVLGSQSMILPLFALVICYSAIGFIDDILTVKPIKGIRGISSKPKALLQFLVAAGFVYWLSMSGQISSVNFFNLFEISGIWYQIFAVFFITGMCNFVNITDGLDGLVSGLTIIASIAILFGISSIYSNQSMNLQINTLIAACLAFLWFNAYPAKVFMGDTGSLALGAALSGFAVIWHLEVFIIIAGLVFIIDGLSSALQWAVFKFTRITTGTGKRVFKKSPIHHHFELCGWSEQTIVVRFWIMGIIAAFLAVMLKF